MVATSSVLMAGFLRHSFQTYRSIYLDLLNILCESSKSEFGFVRLFDEDLQHFSLTVWTNSALPFCETSHDEHFPIDQAGPWADSIRFKNPVFTNQTPKAKSGGNLKLGEFKIFRHIGLPIYEEGEIVGILGMGNSRVDYHSDDLIKIEAKLSIGWPAAKSKAEMLNQVSVEHLSVFSEDTSENLTLKFLNVIVRAVEIRDEYTQHHQTNVSYLAETVAEELDMGDQFKFGLKLGSMVHDIGKITIPSQILNKTGVLKPAEFALLQMHAENGGAMFKGIDFPWPIGEMVEQHHERLDGSGYPKGLTGNEICLEAKIIGIVDTFDAMANERPYRKSLGSGAAIEQIKKERGTKFDPYIVDAFLTCFESDSTFGGRYAPE